MPFLNRQNDPPPPGPNVNVRRLKANQRLQFILLGAPWGTWTHWTGQTTEPCLRPKKECPGCKTGKPHRWKCYLHVWNINRQTDEFLELTALAMQQLDDLLPRGEAHRGQRIEVIRGNGAKARLTILCLPPCEVRGKLPEAKDPFKTLCKLWGFPQIADQDDGSTDVSPGLTA